MPEPKKCDAYAGSLARGLTCGREIGHPGIHRDDYVDAWWYHGAPKLDVIEIPDHEPSDPS